MVSTTSAVLDTQFAALADPIRRGILEQLRSGNATVGELAEPFGVSPPTISHHLKVLETADLISRTRHGRQHICSLRPATLRRSAAWLLQYREFWEERIDALESHLASWEDE